LYVDYAKKGESVSLATDSTSGKKSQCVYNENPILKKVLKLHSKDKERNEGGTNFELLENMFNVYLPYCYDTVEW